MPRRIIISPAIVATEQLVKHQPKSKILSPPQTLDRYKGRDPYWFDWYVYSRTCTRLMNNFDRDLGTPPGFGFVPWAERSVEYSKYYE